MGFKYGLVGLLNVGKSTLFNALTQTAAAQAANYPFCTIEPNVDDVALGPPRAATTRCAHFVQRWAGREAVAFATSRAPLPRDSTRVLAAAPAGARRRRPVASPLLLTAHFRRR